METLNNNQQTIGLQFFSDEDINANIRMLMIDNTHNKQQAITERAIGGKSIVNFMPAKRSYSMVASSLPFLT